MQVTCMGAAQSVTGSCYIVEAAGKRFAIDCGMHQGSKQADDLNEETQSYKAKELDFILLTHAHIDHSGLLPRMVKFGFKGKIYCTAPTLDLMPIMLKDAAHIQEMESQWANQKIRRHGSKKPLQEPLYSTQDALNTLKYFQSIQYNISFNPSENITVKYINAGHILGSAILEIEIVENGKTTKLAFSGDLGRPNADLLHDHAFLTSKPDYLFLESTYGDRNHKNEQDTLKELAEAIDYSAKRKGKVLIPAFAIERTQEILYSLYVLKKQGKLPLDMPVFVDSPMAIEATKVFSKYSKELDLGELKSFEELESYLQVEYTLSVAESVALNSRKGPCIIISASGMCNAGRIKHHLKNSAYFDSTSIVFVGFQAMGTPGRRIVEGERNITMLGEPLEIKAKVFTIGGFSAHAGQSQLLDWLRKSPHENTHVFLVHGEKRAIDVLANLIIQEFALNITIPVPRETIALAQGQKPLSTAILPCQQLHFDFHYVKELLDLDMKHLQGKFENLCKLDKEAQKNAYDQIMGLHETLKNIIQSS